MGTTQNLKRNPHMDIARSHMSEADFKQIQLHLAAIDLLMSKPKVQETVPTCGTCYFRLHGICTVNSVSVSADLDACDNYKEDF